MGEDKENNLGPMEMWYVERLRPTYRVWVDLVLDIEVLSILAQDVHKKPRMQK